MSEFFSRTLSSEGYSGCEVRVTHARTEIIIRATHTQEVLGEKGRRIRELTALVQKRFRFPEGSVELYAEKVQNRGLDAVAQCESLRYKLLGGLAVRRCVARVHSLARGARRELRGDLEETRADFSRSLSSSFCLSPLARLANVSRYFPRCPSFSSPPSRFTRLPFTSTLAFAACSACYGVLRFVMESGAKGCEVVVSGKLRAARAKSMKFTDGFMLHSGQPARDFVDSATRHVLMRQGVLGIKVKIMKPWDPEGRIGPAKPLPDVVTSASLPFLFPPVLPH